MPSKCKSQLTYAVMHTSSDERSTDLEDGAVPDIIELHTVTNPNAYILPNVVLHLQMAQCEDFILEETESVKVLHPCLKRASSMQGGSTRSMEPKVRRNVTFKDKLEIREFEKYLVPDIDELSADSDFEYEDTTTLSKP